MILAPPPVFTTGSGIYYLILGTPPPPDHPPRNDILIPAPKSNGVTFDSNISDEPKLSQRDQFLAEIANSKSRRRNQAQTLPPKAKPKFHEPEVTKSDLIMELLGFMEAPGGNVSEYAEKCTLATDTARNFIDTFVRRGWLLGVRVDVHKGPKCPIPEPCTIWPGKEWTRAIELKDISKEELENTFPKSQILHNFNLYRFFTTYSASI